MSLWKIIHVSSFVSDSELLNVGHVLLNMTQYRVVKQKLLTGKQHAMHCGNIRGQVGNRLSPFCSSVAGQVNVANTGSGGGQQNTYATYLPLHQEFCKAVKGTCWQEFYCAQITIHKILCMYVCTLCLLTAVFAVCICCLFPSSIISIHSPSGVSVSQSVEP